MFDCQWGPGGKNKKKTLFQTGSSAGGCLNDAESYSLNPQFKIVLEDSDEDDDEFCTSIVSLMQKGTRGNQCNRESNGCLSIGGLYNFLK